MRFWKELEGKTIAGRYTLGTLLRSTDRGAWFTTTDEKKPWVLFVVDAANDDDALLRNLEAASRLKHPNVVAIEKTGRARIDDKPVVFALLESTEENLGEVLRERALTPDETAEITSSLVAGLTAIHEHGLSHGQVNPANVLASGDTVKLSSDGLQKVTAENRAEAFAQDTGDLGATVFEALTQKKLTSPEDPAINKLPVPFRSIVHSAVIGRWGLADIATRVEKACARGNTPSHSKGGNCGQAKVRRRVPDQERSPTCSSKGGLTSACRCHREGRAWLNTEERQDDRAHSVDHRPAGSHRRALVFLPHPVPHCAEHRHRQSSRFGSFHFTSTISTRRILRRACSGVLRAPR